MRAVLATGRGGEGGGETATVVLDGGLVSVVWVRRGGGGGDASVTAARWTGGWWLDHASLLVIRSRLSGACTSPAPARPMDLCGDTHRQSGRGVGGSWAMTSRQSQGRQQDARSMARGNAAMRAVVGLAGQRLVAAYGQAGAVRTCESSHVLAKVKVSPARGGRSRPPRSAQRRSAQSRGRLRGVKIRLLKYEKREKAYTLAHLEF